MMLRNSTLMVAIMLALGGCDDKPQSSAPAATTETADLSMKEFMRHVVEYSAGNVWKWQGWTADSDGQKSLFPASDEEWEQAEGAALTLSEVVATLRAPPRLVDEPEWKAATLRVEQVSRELARSAEARRPDRLFVAGSALNEACETCHLAYAPHAIRSKAMQAD